MKQICTSEISAFGSDECPVCGVSLSEEKTLSSSSGDVSLQVTVTPGDARWIDHLTTAHSPREVAFHLLRLDAEASITKGCLEPDSGARPVLEFLERTVPRARRALFDKDSDCMTGKAELKYGEAKLRFAVEGVEPVCISDAMMTVEGVVLVLYRDDIRWAPGILGLHGRWHTKQGAPIQRPTDYAFTYPLEDDERRQIPDLLLQRVEQQVAKLNAWPVDMGARERALAAVRGMEPPAATTLGEATQRVMETLIPDAEVREAVVRMLLPTAPRAEGGVQ